MYVSATDGALEDFSTQKLDALLESCGLEDHIFAQHTLKGQRSRTGNQMLNKEFPGGFLKMRTANSAPGLRMNSIRYLLMDEIEAYPWDVNNEGNPVKLAEERTSAWGDRAKKCYVSTPSIDGHSHIQNLFLSGDQRHYHVPCPFCSEMITFVWEQMRWEMKDNGQVNYKSIFYECPKCLGKIDDQEHKYAMLQAGKWIASATSTKPTRRSYHINQLYSLMQSWRQIIDTKVEADNSGDLEDMRAFVNMKLGLPFRETGNRSDLRKIIALRGSYSEDTVPDGVLYLTAGADVQKGSETDPNRPARIELEIMGHGRGYRSWSLGYHIFYGSTLYPHEGAFLGLLDFIKNGGFQLRRNDGFVFGVNFVMIDAGWNQNCVYDFCQPLDNIVPCKGFGFIQSGKKDKKGNKTGYRTVSKTEYIKRYATLKIPGGQYLYEISTNLYKKKLYDNLSIERADIDPQRPGFCEFPMDRGEKYFTQLRAAERMSDGSYKSGQRADEALDCRIYGMCAGDVFLDMEVANYKDHMRLNGANTVQMGQVKHRTILEMMERDTCRIIPG